MDEKLASQILVDVETTVTHLPYFAVYNSHPCFWPILSGKKNLSFYFFSVIYLFIFRYLLFVL